CSLSSVSCWMLVSGVPTMLLCTAHSVSSLMFRPHVSGPIVGRLIFTCRASRDWSPGGSLCSWGPAPGDAPSTCPGDPARWPSPQYRRPGPTAHIRNAPARGGDSHVDRDGNNLLEITALRVIIATVGT